MKKRDLFARTAKHIKVFKSMKIKGEDKELEKSLLFPSFMSDYLSGKVV